jgi:hypothetical protein
MESPQDKHTLGGVLSIVSGTIGILSALVIILMVFLFGFLANMADNGENFSQSDSNIFTIFLVVYGVIGLVYIALGVLGVVGGIFSLQKKHWGVALAGAIAGSITMFPCGIAATVFVAMAKPEFAAPKPMELPPSI